MCDRKDMPAVCPACREVISGERCPFCGGKTAEPGEMDAARAEALEKWVKGEGGAP